MNERSRLAVWIDGAPLADEPARALWKEFSAHMDEHVGDFAGFAKLKGYVSVSPEHHKGQAVLVISTGKAPAKKLAPPPAKKPGPPPARKPGKGPPPKGRRPGPPKPRKA